jgi:hypothetical protein
VTASKQSQDGTFEENKMILKNCKLFFNQWDERYKEYYNKKIKDLFKNLPFQWPYNLIV